MQNFRCLGALEVLPQTPFSQQNIQRISKIYKGKIYPNKLSIFTPKRVSLGKIGFRGCNPEIQRPLLTPICHNGHIRNLAIVAIDNIVNPYYRTNTI